MHPFKYILRCVEMLAKKIITHHRLDNFQKICVIFILFSSSKLFAIPTDTTPVTTNAMATHKIVATKDEEVESTVLGIMSYTRWTPPPHTH